MPNWRKSKSSGPSLVAVTCITAARPMRIQQGMGVHLSAAATRGEKLSIPRVQKEAAPRPKENELLAVPVTKLYDRGTTITSSELLDQRVGEASISLASRCRREFGCGSWADRECQFQWCERRSGCEVGRYDLGGCRVGAAQHGHCDP